MHNKHKCFTEMHIGPLGADSCLLDVVVPVFPSPILFSAQLLSADDASETLTKATPRQPSSKTSLTFSDSFATLGTGTISNAWQR